MAADVLESLISRFPDLQVEEAKGHSLMLAEDGQQIALLEALKAEGFTLLVDIGMIDHWSEGREPRFDLVYILRKPTSGEAVWVKVKVGDGETPPTAIPVFHGANWPEREIYDLFGVTFAGHPNMERILMPDEWEGHPLRRDYPIVGTMPTPPLARE